MTNNLNPDDPICDKCAAELGLVHRGYECTHWYDQCINCERFGDVTAVRNYDKKERANEH